MENPPKAETVRHHYAGVLLVTDSGEIIGQRRDNKPTIDNPNKISTFGGTVEPGENPRVAAWRELTQEETNLRIDQDDFKIFEEDVAWRALTREWEARHFYRVQIRESALQSLSVFEGQGWAYITGPDDPALIALRPHRRSFLYFALLA